jgi:hypothetical protein
MQPPGSRDTIVGICHARGPNDAIPPQSLVSIDVADLAASMKAYEAKGGAVVTPVRDMAAACMAAPNRGRAGVIDT